MSIPESQLEIWSHQGAVTTAKSTKDSIKFALDCYNHRPDNIKYDLYLQGSYKNNTNIWGDMDVDIILQLNNTFCSNLNKEQEKSLEILLRDLCEAYPKAEISYHRNFANKTCPGKLISDNWAKNLIRNNNTSMIIKKENEPMLYVPVGNKLIHFKTDWPTYAKDFESETIIELNEKEFEKFEVIKTVTINNQLSR